MSGYKIFVLILRPVMLFLAATIVYKFGQSAFKKMLNGVVIFLTVIALLGCYMIFNLSQKVLDPYYFATYDDISQLIVGTVMVTFLLLIALGYFFVANNTQSNFAKHFVILGFQLLPCLAFMGFSIPLCLLEQIAGKIIGFTIEIIALLVAIRIVRKYIREVKEFNEEK